MTVENPDHADLLTAALRPMKAALSQPGQLADALRAARSAHLRVQALRRALTHSDALDPEAELALAEAVSERDHWHRSLGARLVALLDRIEAADRSVGDRPPAVAEVEIADEVVCPPELPEAEPMLSDDDALSDDPTEEFSPVLAPEPVPPPAPSPPAAAADLHKLITGFGKGPAKGWAQAQAAPCWPDHELEALGPPQRIDSVAAFIAEHGRLRAAIQQRQAWARLARAEHRRLLALVVHRLRHLQDEAAEHAIGLSLDGEFEALTQHSSAHRPGSVQALRRDARPKRGSWLAEAQADWAALSPEPAPMPAEVAEALRGLLADGADDDKIKAMLPREVPEGPDRALLLGVLAPQAERVAKLPGYATLKAALKEHLAVEEAEEALQDSALPRVPPELLARTAGKRAVIVGGDKRGDAQARILAGLQLKSLDWETGEGVRRASSTAERCANGSFDLVIFLKRFISHTLTSQVLPRCGPEVEVVWIDQGYGLSAVVRAMSGGCARAR